MTGDNTIVTNEEITRMVYKESATRVRLHQALEREFGSFDCFGMTAADIASFALKKFGLPASDDPVTALDSYLLGRQRGKDERGGERVWRGNGIDGAERGSLVDDYIQGRL
jgi:hypothetical protein